MWYFAWIFVLGLAATVAILNALWYQLRAVRAQPAEQTEHLDTP
ncbi:MAG: cyd operon protein YbgT [Mesorhizobium sp. 61-13]|nr:MAG: cyd operon protein YbgT [Mesorhizobium sp. 61-13]